MNRVGEETRTGPRSLKRAGMEQDSCCVELEGDARHTLFDLARSELCLWARPYERLGNDPIPTEGDHKQRANHTSDPETPSAIEGRRGTIERSERFPTAKDAAQQRRSSRPLRSDASIRHPRVREDSWVFFYRPRPSAVRAHRLHGLDRRYKQAL